MEHTGKEMEIIQKWSVELCEMFSLAVTAEGTCPTCQAKIILESFVMMSILNELVGADEMRGLLGAAITQAEETFPGETPEGYQERPEPGRGLLN